MKPVDWQCGQDAPTAGLPLRGLTHPRKRPSYLGQFGRCARKVARYPLAKPEERLSGRIWGVILLSRVAKGGIIIRVSGVRVPEPLLFKITSAVRVPSI